MNEKKIVDEVMKKEGVTQASLSKALGWKSQQVVGNKLTRDVSMRVDDLVKMLEAMNYEVVIRKSLGDKQEWKVDYND